MANSSRATSVVLLGLLLLITSPALAQWRVDGVPICEAASDQWDPQLVADGEGGAFAVWHDYRNGGADIYAQHFDALGRPLWDVDGVPVCTQEQSQWEPVLVLDDAGGVIIAWEDQRQPEDGIFAQRLNADGQLLWATDGAPVSVTDDDEYEVCIVSDAAGGAIVIWADERLAPSDIYAQRLDPDGNPLWTLNGVALCSEGDDQYAPRAIPDGTGGAITVWKDSRGAGLGVFAQRVDALGITLWTAGGVDVCPGVFGQSEPELVRSGTEGAIVVWEDQSDLNGRDIYAQRLDAFGNLLWGTTGAPVVEVPENQEEPFVTSDGADGAIVAWQDRAGTDDSIHAQRIDDGGNRLWGNEGMAVCIETSIRASARLVSDGSGGAIVTWRDWRNGGTGEDLYAQRLNPDGDGLWTLNGEALCTAPGGQGEQRLVENGDGGAIVIWEDSRTGPRDIFAQRIRGDGQMVPVLLQSSSVEVAETGVRLTWSIAGAERESAFRVFRSRGADPTYRALAGTPHLTDRSFSFVDDSTLSGERYRYRVDLKEGERTIELFTTEWVVIPLTSLALRSVAPNPFSQETSLVLFAPSAGSVELSIHDVQGRLVTVLLREVIPGGEREVFWDGHDARGRAVAAGTYIARLTHANKVVSRRLTLAR